MDLRSLLKNLSALGTMKLNGSRFDPTPGRHRPPPIELRALGPDDMSAAREIYQLNEPGRFPSGFLPEFERTVALPAPRFVVACAENEIVGVGGMATPPGVTLFASLFFGLVHPRWHRKGIGSALLLGRLCMLPAPDPYWKLSLSPVHDAWSYYARFGFSFCGRMKMAGHDFDVYDALLYRQQWTQCRKILDEAGVTGTQALVDERVAADQRAEAAKLRDV